MNQEYLEFMDDNFRKIASTNLKISVEFKELSENEIHKIVNNDKVIENIDKVIQHLIKANYSVISWLRQKIYYYSNKEYNYISDDTSIKAGDRVLFDILGELVIADVLKTAFYNKFDAPSHVNKTKLPQQCQEFLNFKK